MIRFDVAAQTYVWLHEQRKRGDVSGGWLSEDYSMSVFTYTNWSGHTIMWENGMFLQLTAIQK